MSKDKSREKPFTARFTMVSHRRHGVVGVVSEVPHSNPGEREFRVVWEDRGFHGPNPKAIRQLYSPKDLLGETIAHNTAGKRLMLELISGPWFLPAAEEEEDDGSAAVLAALNAVPKLVPYTIPGLIEPAPAAG